MKELLYSFDFIFSRAMRRWGVPVLRVALGTVFFWFGTLKVSGISPVADLVRETFSFMPYPEFFLLLGLWEMVVGLGLIFKIQLRFTLALLWVQMLGTFVSLLLRPDIFFTGGNIFLLTTYGEFIIKNLVLAASGLVIGGHEIKPYRNV